EQAADAKLIRYGCDRKKSQTQVGKSELAKSAAHSRWEEIGRSRCHWIDRRVQIRRACESAGPTRSRSFRSDDTRCDGIHFTTHTANAFEKSSDDELL